MANRLTFQSNNGEMLVFFQAEDDANVHVNRWDENGNGEHTITIPYTDCIMLYNLYRYVKENDIKNDFINPNGKNKEVL